MIDEIKVLNLVQHHTRKLWERATKEGRHVHLIVEVDQSLIRLTNVLKQAPIDQVDKPVVRGFLEAAEELVLRNKRPATWRFGWDIARALRGCEEQP